MKIWIIGLIMVIATFPIGIILRVIADNSFYGLKSWTKNGKENMRIVLSNNWFLWLLLACEGLVGNIGLLLLIVGIPIRLILGK